MKIDEQDRFVVINHTTNSLYSLIADGQYRALSPPVGRNIWMDQLVGEEASLEPNCNMEGLNVVCPSSSAKVRIGIIANDWNYCGDCSSFLGFGGPASYIACGNYGYTSIPAMGYILIQ